MLVTEIEHPSHPQHLLKLERALAPFICDGCQEIGFGECYQCECCNFHIHKECARPSSPAYHHLFKGCRFEFYDRSPIPGGRVCDGCGKDVKGFVYQCSHKDPRDSPDLHPCCTKLQSCTREGVTLLLMKKASSRCNKCHNRCDSSKGPKGWCYVSSCGEYCFHVACVKEMIYQAWENNHFHHQQGGADYYTGTAHLALQTVPSNRSEIVRHGGQSLGGGKSGKWMKAIMVLRLIISAIFGDPITGLASLIIALAQSLFSN